MTTHTLSPEDNARFKLAQNRGVSGFSLEEEGKWTGPFMFMQMADCQLGMMEYNRGWEKENALLERAVTVINQAKPRFLIVCGDLTNSEPGEPQYPQQVADYKRIMNGLDRDIPQVCLCGNHDIGNAPTADSISSYVDHFGDHYYSFWVSGVHCVVVNSCLYFNSNNSPKLFSEQEEWLAEELKKSADNNPVHRIFFSHHSWFIDSPDEPDHYFNIPTTRRQKFLEQIDTGISTKLFAGHYHRNAGGYYKDIEMVTTGAVGMPLGKDPSGLRVVQVHEDRIDHYFKSIEAVPAMS